MPTGTIIRVNAEKGFGFIERDGALPDAFFSASSAESVAEFWLGEAAEVVVEGDFDGFVRAKAVGLFWWSV
ncbi:MAG: cold-shock protein [Planctomycetaceae bacterium]